ncbi:MAG: chorismate-binding protein, partial [bacterium]
PRPLAPAAGDFRTGPFEPGIPREAYLVAAGAVRSCISRGHTYQANLTFPLHADFEGDPYALFLRLARAQGSRHGFYLDTGAHAICCATPELFLERRGGTLRARPMKGTAPRGRWPEEDTLRAEELRASKKERAENIMITDMVRNDIGRIAETGSVTAEPLWAAERYPTLWQMTSTVEGRSRAPLPEVLAATFPCASITGAPKHRTMQIIRELEPGPRGVYTGAAGWYDPGGDFSFGVTIRTAVVDRDRGRVRFDVGSGVTWDSEPEREWEECLLKSRILEGERPGFRLLETLRWEPGEGFVRLEGHLARMAASAGYFDRPFDRQRVLAAVQAALPGASAPRRVRIMLDAAGRVEVESAPLDEVPGRPVEAGFARTPVDPADVFLFHKTTLRDTYQTALRSRPDCEEVLLWNRRGELTEASRANVVAEIGGRHVTPPREAGLLAGVLRAELLERGEIEEAPITVEEAGRADRLWLISSLRGRREVRLVEEGDLPSCAF